MVAAIIHFIHPGNLAGAGDELHWLSSVNWTAPLLLICLAVGVLFWSRQMAARRKRGGAKRSGSGRNLDFDLEIARLENQAPVAIADAKPGLVHIRGTIESAVGSLGGTKGRERIWYNRAGAARHAAIGVDLCLVADESGRVALEDLGSARVIAPKQGPTDDAFMSLQIGDHVEVLGSFIVEHVKKQDAQGTPPDVFGVVGRDRQLQVRVLERPTTPSQPEATPATTAPEAADTHVES